MRNLRLCTKDCLCLYVCPTGATDTENSIIDRNKCVGCGACANACPSAAISMVPRVMPPQQPKEERVAEALRSLIRSKTQAENLAAQLPGALAAAAAQSSRLMAEDLCRESGYMLPQSEEARAFLERLRTYPGIPLDVVEALLNTLPGKRGNGIVCGHVRESPRSAGFRRPVCGQGAHCFARFEP